MVKDNSIVNILTASLLKFYEQKGCTRDLMFYKGHSKLSKPFVKLYVM